MTEPGTELDELARRVIGAAIEVHRALGPGFLESAYEEAMCIEMNLRELSYVRQPSVALSYKGQPIGAQRLDFIVDDRLVVELKTVDTVLPIHRAQVIAYLKATKLKLALLLNFNEEVIRNGIFRYICS